MFGASPITERDAQFFEVLLGQTVEDVDAVVGKYIGIFAQPQTFEP